MKSFTWFRRRSWERKMDAEFRFHMEAQVDDYIVHGACSAANQLRFLGGRKLVMHSS